MWRQEAFPRGSTKGMLLLVCQEVLISQFCYHRQPEPGTEVVHIYVQGHDVALEKLPSKVAAGNALPVDRVATVGV